MAMEYEFDDRLGLSQGVSRNKGIREILVENIPAALNAHPAHTENDRTGVDWWVERYGGPHLAVDVKVRARDYKPRGKDDLALETWSIVDRVPGWTRDPNKRADFIMWLWLDTGRWCMVPFPMLCKVFTDKWQDWKARFKTRQQFTPSGSRGYHSECVFVPRKVVWRAFYDVFGGETIDGTLQLQLPTKRMQ